MSEDISEEEDDSIIISSEEEEEDASIISSSTVRSADVLHAPSTRAKERAAITFLDIQKEEKDEYVQIIRNH